MTTDLLLYNATVATMEPLGRPYGLLSDSAVGVSDGVITFVGPTRDAPDAQERRDMLGGLLTPALIDCHTHLVFGGDRVEEFEQRLGGRTYEQISADGGGIMSTVTATGLADHDNLANSASRRLKSLLHDGVGTVEIKSGYGLDRHGELNMLRVARALDQTGPLRITTSLLAAHAIPARYSGAPDDYIDEICEDILPAAHAEGLVDCVDAFCERIAFTPAQVSRVFDAAGTLGLPVRLHADQLSDSGGALLAARYRALSADHLEHSASEGLAAMADAGTVGVVIPGASVFLDDQHKPDIATMRESGVRIAVSTDLNPGTSPVGSLTSAMWLAVARFRLSPEEALAGTTVHAAAALGLTDTGIIRAGMRADLSSWATDDPAALSYWIGLPMCESVWVGGRLAFDGRSRD